MVMGNCPSRQWAITQVTDGPGVGQYPNMAQEETWRRRLREAVGQSGAKTMKALSLAAGLGETFVRDVLERGRVPSIENLIAISDKLDVSVGWLLEESGGDAMPVDVPLLGSARGAVAGSKNHKFTLNRSVSARMVARPPGLADARNAYAVLVDDSSMTPMHPPGELRFIDPERGYGAGDSVLVILQLFEKAATEAFIKILVSDEPGEIRTRQLNPEATIIYKREKVIAVHRVMTTSELFVGDF